MQKEVVEKVTDTVTDMAKYGMSTEEIEQLPSTEIIEQTEEQENAQEQEVEGEEFKLQGEVAYNGTIEYPNVSLGEYKGLTYRKFYTNNRNKWMWTNFRKYDSNSL